MSSATAQSENVAFVQQLTLFSDISPADCIAIISAAREENYPRSQTIFSIGDGVEQVVLLLSGWVKITQPGPKGTK